MFDVFILSRITGDAETPFFILAVRFLFYFLLVILVLSVIDELIYLSEKLNNSNL